MLFTYIQKNEEHDVWSSMNLGANKAGIEFGPDTL